MAVIQSSRKCRACNRKTLHQRPKSSDLVHLVMTVLTVGLWLPIWVLAALGGLFSAWRCQLCGKAN